MNFTNPVIATELATRLVRHSGLIQTLCVRVLFASVRTTDVSVFHRGWFYAFTPKERKHFSRFNSCLLQRLTLFSSMITKFPTQAAHWGQNVLYCVFWLKRFRFDQNTLAYTKICNRTSKFSKLIKNHKYRLTLNFILLNGAGF